MAIQHSSHKHDLYLEDTNSVDEWFYEEEEKAFNMKVWHRCQLCGKEIRGLYYSCPPCQYKLHFLCATPFLREINHPSHPNHPLTLWGCFAHEQFTCCICHRQFKSFGHLSTYRCVKCDFQIDAYCVLRIPTVTYEGNDHNQHLCHHQPMELVEIKHGKDDEVLVKCCMCELPISSQAYTCKICRHFFHINSCAELSPKIRHPLHLRHRLILKISEGDDTKCHSCDKTCLNFSFCCPHAHCKFYMCIGCTLLRPTVRPIKYEGHNHLLYLAKKVNREDTIECCASYTYCKQLVVSSNELSHTQDYIFWCEDCDFGVHMLCGPLPCTIKHKAHVHPLTLFDSMVEDDSGEYYCDACETERDPRICVYYCADCKYIAHVHCVISEVVRVLQGDCREVELRAVGQPSNHLVLKMKEEEEVTHFTLLDLFNCAAVSLNIHVRERQQYLEEEEEEEKNIWKPFQREDNANFSFIMDSSLRSGAKYYSDQRTKLSSEGLEISHKQVERKKSQVYFSSTFTDENLEELIHSFDYHTIKVTPDELEMKIVNVEDYWITWNLAHVLKDLLAKHGDISGGHDQNKSTGNKSLLYFLLCRIVYNMSRIMVVDLTEDLLGDWYSCLKFLKSNGFEVDFVNSHLQQIVRAYVGLQISRAEIVKRTKLDEKILNLQEQIVNLQGKLKRCERKRSERLRRGSSETSTDLVKECLNKASKFKWKNVADSLL